MSNSIKIAVVGCGYWGPNLLRNFAENNGAELGWLCDLDAERVRSLGRRYPAARTTTDFREVVEDAAVDAVVIATPVETHYKLAKAALERGKHVLVEKPFTASVREAEELLELADGNNLQILVDHVFLYTGAVRKIKNLIETGELGDLLYFDSTRINLGLFQPDINVVWDLAPHDFSILDYLVGNKKPVSISAVGSSHISPGIENIAYVMLKFDSEFIAHFHFNWLAPVKIRRTLLAGTKKMVVYDDVEPSEKVRVYDKGVNSEQIKSEIDREARYQTLVSYRTGDVSIPKLDNTEALKLVCQDFLDAINQQRKPLTDGAAGLRVVRLLEAAQISIRNNGAAIKL